MAATRDDLDLAAKNTPGCIIDAISNSLLMVRAAAVSALPGGM